MKKIKITFITTLNHNIGDDFVREGIEYLLDQAIGKKNIEYNYINKHKPFSCWKFLEKLKFHKVKKVIDLFLSFFNVTNFILRSDLVIQSGAPVYWCQPERDNHCYRNEWFSPILKKKVFKKRIPFINIGAGSCQPYFSDHKSFCENCKSYTKTLFHNSRLTIVRDFMSIKLHSDLKLKAFMLPCPSIFAIDKFRLRKNKSQYIALNIMELGGHYALDINVKKSNFKDILLKFYAKISKDFRVVFVCHDQKEVNYIKKIDSNIPYFYRKNNHKAYLEFYSKSLYGILNRVHGAFILKSFGIPVYLIGNDSRTKMGKLINIKHTYINEISYNSLLNFHKLAIKNKKDNEFNTIKSKAKKEYISLLENNVSLIND